MLLKHVALVCSSEEKSDKFYESLLGLKKVSSKMIPSTLSKQIFNLDSELKIIDYAVDEIHFEVFIDNQKVADDKKIEHICLEIDDLEAITTKSLKDYYENVMSDDPHILPALETVLKHYMLPDEFKQWKKEKVDAG